MSRSYKKTWKYQSHRSGHRTFGKRSSSHIIRASERVYLNPTQYEEYDELRILTPYEAVNPWNIEDYVYIIWSDMDAIALHQYPRLYWLVSDFISKEGNNITHKFKGK